mmetsp:Transcript_26504/g.43574  ORF Transcript_26504/g.43574 Transcript_26504/m.43574 type:complete len:479 (-) Transcript_26504:189-1625(-)
MHVVFFQNQPRHFTSRMPIKTWLLSLLLVGIGHTLFVFIVQSQMVVPFVHDPVNLPSSGTSRSLDNYPKDQPRSDSGNFRHSPNSQRSNAGQQERKGHPHKGARFPNGTLGYVADVTHVRRSFIGNFFHGDEGLIENAESLAPKIPLSYLPLQKEETSLVCNQTLGEGVEGTHGWKLLAEKIVVANSSTPSSTEVRQNNHPPRQRRVLCAIYTHAAKKENIRAVVETWGWRCDGFFAASTSTDPDIGAIDLLHYGPEEYENMWQKTRSMLAYMYDNYLNDFEYFFLSGDDTHLIVENLRKVLHSMGPSAQDYPLYLGAWSRDPHNKTVYFVSGAGGYVINRATLKLVVEDGLAKYHAKSQVAAEDRYLSNVLRMLGVVGNSSMDEYGAQRFHIDGPQRVATYSGIDSVSQARKNRFMKTYEFWGDTWGRKYGVDLTSSESVSFHLLKKPHEMKRHHAILYRSCPSGTYLGDHLRSGSP